VSRQVKRGKDNAGLGLSDVHLRNFADIIV
jgi:hypothetical protein